MGIYMKSNFKMLDLSSYHQKAPCKSQTRYLQKCYSNFHFLNLSLTCKWF